jgi:hypothetical protein
MISQEFMDVASSFAKPLGWEIGLGGSNPPLSAAQGSTDALGSAKNPPPTVISAAQSSRYRRGHSAPLSRTDAHRSVSTRPPSATDTATELLPEMLPADLDFGGCRQLLGSPARGRARRHRGDREGRRKCRSTLRGQRITDDKARAPYVRKPAGRVLPCDINPLGVLDYE